MDFTMHDFIISMLACVGAYFTGYHVTAFCYYIYRIICKHFKKAR